MATLTSSSAPLAGHAQIAPLQYVTDARIVSVGPVDVGTRNRSGLRGVAANTPILMRIRVVKAEIKFFYHDQLVAQMGVYPVIPAAVKRADAMRQRYAIETTSGAEIRVEVQMTEHSVQAMLHDRFAMTPAFVEPRHFRIEGLPGHNRALLYAGPVWSTRREASVNDSEVAELQSRYIAGSRAPEKCLQLVEAAFAAVSKPSDLLTRL